MPDPSNNLRNEAHQPMDPRLESLLDEALAPRQVPGGIPRNLVDTIVTATSPRLQRRHHILVRLNDLWWPRALAASIVVLASAGIVLTMASIVQQAQAWVSLTRELPAVLHNVDTQQTVAMVPLTELDAQTHALDRDLSRVESEMRQSDLSAQTF